MKKIKIAQIGTSMNSHGQNIFESIKKQKEIFDVVGYALPENENEKFPERMKIFEGYSQMTIEEILNNSEIEAVTVETEEKYLTKYAQMAADSGKHIHMEKPGGICLQDFEKLIETVKKNKTVFHTGYMYRYNPFVIELMEKIKNGELGEILSVEAQMNCIHTENVREWLKDFPGGIMFFLGCHLVDLLLQIQGKPEHIIPLNKSTGTNNIQTQDFGFAVFEYKKGVSFAKVNAVEYGGFARRQLVVTGTKATVELKPFEMTADESNGSILYTGRTTYKSNVWGDRGEYEHSANFDRYNNMMESFAKMVRGEIVNPYTYDYELELYKTILEACGGKR